MPELRGWRETEDLLKGQDTCKAEGGEEIQKDALLCSVKSERNILEGGG